jgi:hypothetical protein
MPPRPVRQRAPTSQETEDPESREDSTQADPSSLASGAIRAEFVEAFLFESSRTS